MKIQSVFVLPQSLYSRYCTTHLVPWNLYIISYLSISLGSSWFFCLWYNSLPQPFFSCWAIIAQLNVTPSPRHPIPNILLGSPVQCPLRLRSSLTQFHCNSSHVSLEPECGLYKGKSQVIILYHGSVSSAYFSYCCIFKRPWSSGTSHLKTDNTWRQRVFSGWQLHPDCSTW